MTAPDRPRLSAHSLPAPAAGDTAGALRGGLAAQGRALAATLRLPRGRALPVLLFLLAYLVPLAVVPPTLGLPLIDDWNYQLSVEHLVDDGELWVAPWTAATLVLQVGWGALFALPFGVEPVALRVSTLVAGFGGTLACYGLFRELGATRLRAVIGGLAVWLNPITFGLSYTFMTDVPYLTLLSLAAYLTVRALRRERLLDLAAGSALAGLAFLVRQQGGLIPLAALAWLLLVQPLPAWLAPRAARLRAGAAILLPCLVAVAGYFLWATTNGLPETQSDYLDSLREAGLWGTVDLTWRIVVIGIFFAGLFALPVVMGSLDELPDAWRRMGTNARYGLLLMAGALALWTRWYYVEYYPRSFPFIPWGSMIHEDGLGVLDAWSWRPPLIPMPWGWLTIGVLCALSAASAFVLVVGRRPPATQGVPAPQSWGELERTASAPPRIGGRGGADFWPSAAGLMAMLGIGQLVGAVPPSMLIRQYITFDRYYLPLLPFVLGIALWALRGRRFDPGLPLAALLILGVVNTLGVQDWLAFKRAQWETGEWLLAQGVSDRQLDVSAQWAGLRFYEYSLEHPRDTVRRRAGDVWWLYLVAPMVDPVYIVAASPAPRRGYTLYAKRPYDSWSRSEEESYVYVWKRNPTATTQPTTRTTRSTDAKDQSAPTPTPVASRSLPPPPGSAAPTPTAPPAEAAPDVTRPTGPH